MAEGWFRPDRLKGAPEGGRLTRRWPDDYTRLEQRALQERCGEVLGAARGEPPPADDWWQELRR